MATDYSKTPLSVLFDQQIRTTWYNTSLENTFQIVQTT